MRGDMQVLTPQLGVNVAPKLEAREFNTYSETADMTLGSPGVKMRIDSKFH